LAFSAASHGAARHPKMITWKLDLLIYDQSDTAVDYGSYKSDKRKLV